METSPNNRPAKINGGISGRVAQLIIFLTLGLITLVTYLLMTYDHDPVPLKNAPPLPLPPIDTLFAADRVDILAGGRQLNYRAQDFDAFILDLEQHHVKLFHADSTGAKLLSAANLLPPAADSIPLMLTNGGIFHPDFSPVGLLVANGNGVGALNLEEGNGNFFLQPNGVFYQTSSGDLGVKEANAFARDSLDLAFATQSGPMLLIDGELHPRFNEGSPNLKLRSGVGLLSPTQAVFIISLAPVNFYDFAMLFKEEFACENALYLDGVISDMYLPALGRQSFNGQFSSFIACYGLQ